MIARGLALLLAAAAGCGANAPTYAECGSDQDCSTPMDQCLRLRFARSDGTEGDGTLCTALCVGDADCAPPGTCIQLAGDLTETAFCAARCETSADCDAAFACTRVDEGPPLCLP